MCPREGVDIGGMHLGDQRPLSRTQADEGGVVPLRSSMRMREPGPGVERMVGGQPATRRHGEVVDHRADAEGVADLIGCGGLGLIEEPETRSDYRVEESQRPLEVVEVIVDSDFRADRSREGICRCNDVQISGTHGGDGQGLCL